MRIRRYLLLAACAALALGAVSITTAQYGLVDNYETAPANTTLYGGGGGWFQGGSIGGGAGEVAGEGVGGSVGVDGGVGGDLAGGFYGYANDTGGVDTTVSFAGMSTTGVTISMRDNQNDGDEFGIRAETGGFANSTTWNFTNSSTNYETHSFLWTDPPSGVQGAGVSPENVTSLVWVGVGFNGVLAGDANFDLDNVGFIGDNSPNTGAVEDYEAYGLGPASPSPNNYGGGTAAFEYSGGGGASIGTADVVDTGGNQAYQVAITDTQTPVRGGVLIDLVPVAGNVDVSAYQSVEFDISSVDADDTFTLQIETVDSPGAPTYWSTPITPPASTVTYRVAFNSLTGGPGAAFDPTLVNRISLVHASEGSANNSFNITIDNVGFSALVPVELSVLEAD
jgi:hypothetical protein